MSSKANPKAIARFRVRRHHLLDEPPADAVTICRDVCGVQAQVMSAAYLQLWTRNHAITRTEIEAALWQSWTLIKTSLMRQTVHLVPTDEFLIYISALRSSRLAAALRVMARFGITREEAESLTPLIMDVLSSEPLGRTAIAAAIRPKVSKRVHAWMEKCWSHVRVPIAEGLICYGAGDDNEVTFTRTDRWLPDLKVKLLSETEAQCALFRKYLHAYGPATPADFAHWAGIPMQQAKSLPVQLEAELEEVISDKKNSFLLREDVSALTRDSGRRTSIRLLPNFDTYLLAHRTKNHLLRAQHYKRVYRNQGWISPVVLIDGAIAGVWFYKPQNKKLLVEIEPFASFSRTVRTAIEQEAACLALFFGRELKLQLR